MGYVMADEEYDKMKNTVRAIKREREAQARAEAARRQEAGEELGQELGGYGGDAAAPYEMTPEEVEAAFPIDGRCEVDPGARRGTVCYAGPIINKKGVPWLHADACMLAHFCAWPQMRPM